MNEYEQQAQDFLKATGTELRIEFSHHGFYFAGDKEKRDVYQFTLKNARGEYTSTFGDSISNTQARDAKNNPQRYWGQKRKPATYRKPSAYDILACLEKYEVDPEFSEWCKEFGYDSRPLQEFPEVFKIHQACAEQYRCVRRLFTEEQMDLLREIN